MDARYKHEGPQLVPDDAAAAAKVLLACLVLKLGLTQATPGAQQCYTPEKLRTRLAMCTAIVLANAVTTKTSPGLLSLQARLFGEVFYTSVWPPAFTALRANTKAEVAAASDALRHGVEV